MTAPAIRLVTKRGNIDAELYPDVAPKTVEHLLELIGRNYYDGLVFHRVVEDFVAQTGCPEGTGSGGPGYNIPDEFNERKHLTGTLSMANKGTPNSGGSQFFICHRPLPHLDGKHTVFGRVTRGIDLVYKIAVGDTVERLERRDHGE